MIVFKQVSKTLPLAKQLVPPQTHSIVLMFCGA